MGAGSVSFRRGSVGTAAGIVDGGLFGAKAVACHGDREVVVMASVPVGRLRRMGTASFCDFLWFLRPTSCDRGQGAHAKTRRRPGRWVCRRRRKPWWLRRFAACPPCVPGRCLALEKGADVGGRTRRRSFAPLGWVFLWGMGPSAHALGYRLTPSRPGAMACHKVGGGFMSLVFFVVEQRRRVEPRSAQRAQTEDEGVQGDGGKCLSRRPQPRCGWVGVGMWTQGRPRSSANPGLGDATPLALMGAKIGREVWAWTGTLARTRTGAA